MVQHAYKEVLDHGVESVSISYNNTDAIALLYYIILENKLSTVYMQVTTQERCIYDIKETFQANKEIISVILAVHTLSDCDNFVSYHVVSVMKRLKGSNKLLHLEWLKANLEQVLGDAACLIIDFHGYWEVSLTRRYEKIRYQKIF